jgi:hypothetical protein
MLGSIPGVWIGGISFRCVLTERSPSDPRHDWTLQVLVPATWATRGTSHRPVYDGYWFEDRPPPPIGAPYRSTGRDWAIG